MSWGKRMDAARKGAIFTSLAAVLVGVGALTGGGAVAQNSSSVSVLSKAPDGSTGNGESFAGDISADGRFAVFTSAASNLVNTTDPNGADDDGYLVDRSTGQITRFNDGHTGFVEHPVISGDGRFVAYWAGPTNVQGAPADCRCVLRWDRQTNTTSFVSNSGEGVFDISGDGRYVIVQRRDTSPDGGDIAEVDMTNGNSILISHTTTGATDASGYFIPGASTNQDGSVVVFQSPDDRLVAGYSGPPRGDYVYQVFAWHRSDGAISLVSHASSSTTKAAGGESNIESSALSTDAKYATFVSDAPDIVAAAPSGRAMYLADLQAASNSRISDSAGGRYGVDDSHSPAISADGAWISFDRSASGHAQTFRIARVNGTAELASHAQDGTAGNDSSLVGAVANSGAVVFTSDASNLVSKDSNAAGDAFANDPAPTEETTSSTIMSTTTTAAAQQPSPTAHASKSSVAPGDDVTVSGDGFKPSSAISLSFHSTPVELGTATVNASGAYAVIVRIPSKAEAGAHTIIVSGVDASGAQRTASAPIQIAGRLVRTGGGFSGQVAIGLALLVLGCAVFLGSKPPRVSGRHFLQRS